VTGGDDDTKVGLKLGNGEKHLGRRHRLPKKLDRKAGTDENRGEKTGKILTANAAIEAYHHPRKAAMPHVKGYSDRYLGEDYIIEGVRSLEDLSVQSLLMEANELAVAQNHKPPHATGSEGQIVDVGLDKVLPAFYVDGIYYAGLGIGRNGVYEGVLEPLFEPTEEVQLRPLQKVYGYESLFRPPRQIFFDALGWPSK